MKKILLLAGCVLSVCIASAQNLDWAKKLGGTNSDQGNAISVDASGNVCTVGTFKGTADFDPGAGTYTLTSLGQEDIFISKLDAAGNFVWAKRFGSTSIDSGRDIVLDASGNVYITGSFYGTVDFDPSPATYTIASIGNSDIFILKLDASGNFVWAKNMGGTGNEAAYSIDLDGTGNVYTTGAFQQTGDFDPGVGTYTLTSAGNSDMFVSKLDSNGDFIWAKLISGSLFEQGNAIAIDPVGDICITGLYSGVVDFNPSPTATYTMVSTGVSNNPYVLKLNSSGDFLWVKKIGGNTAGAKAVDADALGNVYVAGYFGGQGIDFDPDPIGTYTLSGSSDDIYILKLNSTGNFLWAIRMGGTGLDDAYDMVVDPSGNVYTTGYVGPTADCDPGPATYTINPGNSYEIFVSKLDASGNFVGAGNMGVATGSDYGNGITIDALGNVYATGYFGGTADLDPSATGSFTLAATGGADAFVAKINFAITTGLSNGIYNELYVPAMYPNPTTGNFSIELRENTHVVITNALGQIVLDQNLSDGLHTIDFQKEVSGLYFITVMSNGKQSTHKLIKE